MQDYVTVSNFQCESKCKNTFEIVISVTLYTISIKNKIKFDTISKLNIIIDFLHQTKYNSLYHSSDDKILYSELNIYLHGYIKYISISQLINCHIFSTLSISWLSQRHLYWISGIILRDPFSSKYVVLQFWVISLFAQRWYEL